MRQLLAPFANLRQLFRGPAITPATADIIAFLDASAGQRLGRATIADILALVPAPGYIAIEDQKADGTAGDAITANAWTKCTLNTKVADAGNHASVASSVVTLAAGTYKFEGFMVRYSAMGQRMRFYNTADSAVLVGPSMSHAVGTISTTGTNLPVWLFGRFTLAAQKTCEFQYYTNSTTPQIVDPTSSAEVEVYAGIYLTKVA